MTFFVQKCHIDLNKILVRIGKLGENIGRKYWAEILGENIGQ